MLAKQGRVRSAWKRVIQITLLAVIVGAAGSANARNPVKVGLLLSYSGPVAQLGVMVTKGLKLAIDQAGGQLGGRPVQYVKADAATDPARAIPNMQKLISGANVDFVVGPIGSGVAMGAIKFARDKHVMLIIPNAGLDVATRQLCAPTIFRTSFSNWQTDYPMGKVAYDRGYRDVVTITWRNSAGSQHVGAFKKAFKAAGGHIVKSITLPFPSVQFQVPLTTTAKLKPDAVYVFFAGSAAVKFVKDYAAAGLADSIPLLSSGFLTEGVLNAEGAAAEGILTTLHYANGLDNAANKSFRAAFKKRYGVEADVYAMQGYDTGLLLVEAMKTVNGNTDDQSALIDAMENTKIHSPRGDWIFSNAHNPIQNIYLRQVRDGRNVVVGVAAKALKDPATGCDM